MSGRVLVSGATGYVGGRLARALERAGRPLRLLTRRPEALAESAGPAVEVIGGDCLLPETLRKALEGVETAYYLVHSMESGGSFADVDRVAARNFGSAARAAGVKRIVYLGGLGEAGDELSEHLRSRHETGAILQASGVPVVELRASIVIGAGSLSFEMVRALVERLPVMVCPRWVRVKTQPIGVDDVIAYLVAALDLQEGQEDVYEIGGPNVLSYGDLMLEYARLRGLRRLLIPVPFLTTRLSSLWLGLVTPLQARVGRQLIDSLKNPTLVGSDRALRVFPVRPGRVREAMALAVASREHGRPASPLVDLRTVRVPAPPTAAFAPIRRIGGRNGWYAGNVLWRLRGLVDRCVGGVGLRRGRPDPDEIRVGEVLDFWRVEAYTPERRLRLAAEMRLPGRAWLEFEVRPIGPGSEIRQTAVFEPSGLAGLAYWYALLPIHAWIFRRMLRAIAARTSTPADSRETREKENTQMKMISRSAASIAVAAVLAVAGSARAQEKDIVDTAVAAGNFKTLATALQAAGLVDTLKGKGPFTVFAPTDEAFAKIPKADLDALLEDKAKLSAVLTYHVVPGKVMAADVVRLKQAKTVQGGSVTIDSAQGVKVDGASVVKTDVAASNGVIHVIDSVIMPKQ